MINTAIDGSTSQLQCTTVNVTQKFSDQTLAAEIPLTVINISTINHSFTLLLEAINTRDPHKHSSHHN